MNAPTGGLRLVLVQAHTRTYSVYGRASAAFKPKLVAQYESAQDLTATEVEELRTQDHEEVTPCTA